MQTLTHFPYAALAIERALVASPARLEAAARNLGDIASVGLPVHCHHQVHAAAPALNLKSKRLVAPTYPYEEINVVHLTWITKDLKFPIDDGGREISFRYRDVKAHFAD